MFLSLLPFLLAFAIAAFPFTASAFDRLANTNLAVYWVRTPKLWAAMRHY